MYFLVDGNVNLGGSGPENHYAVDTLFSLEAADVFADLFHHVPAVGALLHVVALEAFCVVFVESSLHGLNGFKLILHGENVLLFEHFAVDCRFESVLGINVPCSENDVVKVGNRNDFVIFKILFISAATNTDFVVLRHRTYGFCQSFTDHQNASHECGADCSETYNKNAKFTFGFLYVCFLHNLI